MKSKPAHEAPRWRRADTSPILVGVSSCLLGQRVRWDGGHKAHRFLGIEALGRQVQWVPVCPEVGIGLPVPRDPLRLVRSGVQIRLAAGASPTWWPSMPPTG